MRWHAWSRRMADNSRVGACRRLGGRGANQYVHQGLRRKPPPGTGTETNPIYLDSSTPSSDTEEQDATGTSARLGLTL